MAEVVFTNRRINGDQIEGHQKLWWPLWPSDSNNCGYGQNMDNARELLSIRPLGFRVSPAELETVKATTRETTTFTQGSKTAKFFTVVERSGGAVTE